MTGWLKSPSGWPVYADSAEEQADLQARGYTTLADDQVQAAIDAFPVEPSPPSSLPGWALAADVAAALAAKANASSLPGKLSIADIGNPATSGGAALRAAFGLVSATPAAVPVAPTSVVARARHLSAAVTWKAPVGGPVVDSYTVTASPGGATATASSGATSAVVTGLTDGTAYTFTVTATNTIGGTVSAASNSVTPSPQPGGLSIPDLSAWWDAGQIAGPPANGASVGTWPSVAGNGFTASNATGAEQPTFVSSWANSKPALAFTASKKLPTNLTQLDIGPAMTVFVALDCTGSGLQRVLMNQSASGDANGVFVDTVTGANWRIGAGDGQTASATLTSGAPTIISATAPGFAYFNGAKAATHINPATLTSTPYWISSTPGQSWGLVGRIAEVIMYGRVLSDTERHQVESYLAAKYNLTVVSQ